MDSHANALRVGTDMAMATLFNPQYPFTTLKPVREAYIAGATSYVQALVARNGINLLSPPSFTRELSLRVQQEFLNGNLWPVPSNMMVAVLHADADFYYHCWRDVRYRAGVLPQGEQHPPLVAREVYAGETTIHQTREVLRAWRRYIDQIQASHGQTLTDPRYNQSLNIFVIQAATGFNRWADLVFAHGGYPYEEDSVAPAAPLAVRAPETVEAAVALLGLANGTGLPPPAAPLTEHASESREAAMVLLDMANGQVEVSNTSRAAAPPTGQGRVGSIISDGSDSEVTMLDPELPRYLAESRARLASQVESLEGSSPGQEDIEMAMDSPEPTEGNAEIAQAPSVRGNSASLPAVTQAAEAPAPAPTRWPCDICVHHAGVTSLALLRRHFRLTHGMAIKEAQDRVRAMYP